MTAKRDLLPSAFLKQLLDLILEIPPSREAQQDNPVAAAEAIASRAAWRAAGVSVGLALPPGPWGLLTVFPDLVLIWRIQAQMVADIAGVFGKTACLVPETMIYCLFRHAASHALRNFVVRSSERVLIKRSSVRFLRNALQKAGVHIASRSAQRAVLRWLPLLGAAGVGAYAYADTKRVAKTAIHLFRHEIVIDA